MRLHFDVIIIGFTNKYTLSYITKQIPFCFKKGVLLDFKINYYGSSRIRERDGFFLIWVRAWMYALVETGWTRGVVPLGNSTRMFLQQCWDTMPQNIRGADSSGGKQKKLVLTVWSIWYNSLLNVNIVQNIQEVTCSQICTRISYTEHQLYR